jgi:hypothetical protein
MYIVKLIGRSPAGRRRDKQYHMQSKMAADDLAHRARNNSLKAHVRETPNYSPGEALDDFIRFVSEPDWEK